MVKPRVKKFLFFCSIKHLVLSPPSVYSYNIGTYLIRKVEKKRKEKHKQEKKVKFSLQIRGVNIIPTII